MIDKYLLEDLSLRRDEKGELARWVIQLQADVDTERRKSASLESVIYARDTRIAELEGQLQSGFTPEALAQEERAENAEQRVAELEAKMATPVRLPDDLEPNTEPCVICGKISSHPEGWHYCNRKSNEGDE
ncbi:hypothetical protein ACSIA8_000663 [Serratia marcescens]